MSENQRQPISLQETLQIVDVLFPWMGNIPNLPLKLRLEEMTDTVPCLTLSQEKGGGKSNFNVLGDYDGELLFSIYYKVDGKDTKTRLSATRLLTYIGAYCESATANKEIPIMDEQNEVISITMLDTPTMIFREDNGQEMYMANFSFVYRHKEKR